MALFLSTFISLLLLLLPLTFGDQESLDYGLGDLITGVNDFALPLNESCQAHYFFCDGHVRNARGGWGQCVPDSWRCDNEWDCDDRTDEPNTCPPHSCQTTEFTCALTRRCLPHGHRCDGQVDCGKTLSGTLDDSDEDAVFCSLNAGSQSFKCNVTMQCGPNEQKCLTVDQCVPLAQYCDRVEQCKDGSDEGQSCDADTSAHQCHYHSKPLPDGSIRCYCVDGERPDGPSCVKENLCLRSETGATPVCDQACMFEPKSTLGEGYTCSCADGYRLVDDGRCAVTNGSAALMISNDGDYIVVSTFGFTKRLKTINGYAAQAFDFDFTNGKLCMVTTKFESHVAHTVIKCVSILTDGQDIIYDPPISCDGVQQMAFDWLGANWYFIEETHGRIFVCAGNQFTHCVVLAGEGELEKPGDIALDPYVGYAFLSDWGPSNPGIYRVNMDGTRFTKLVTRKIVHPQAVTLDIVSRTVYWLDSYLHYVHALDYEGQWKRRVVAQDHFLKAVHAMALFDRWLYLSNEWRIDPRTGKRDRDDAVSVHFSRVKRLRVFHRLAQPLLKAQPHPCSVNKGGCSQICLVGYTRSKQSGATALSPVATCRCAAGFYLAADEKTCVESVKDTPMLAVARILTDEIAFLPLHVGPNVTYEAYMPLGRFRRPAALAVGQDGASLYVSDAGNFTIDRVDLRWSPMHPVRQPVVEFGLSSVEGIALDHGSGNIYWTDDGLKQIWVARLDKPAVRKVLVSTGLSHPRAIAVAANAGYFFWGDWQEGVVPSIPDTTSLIRGAKIERAHLDGSGRKVIVTGKHLIHWPNGIVVDEKGGGILWCDAQFDTVHWVDFDGGNSKMILADLHHPYGLAIYDGFLYWTEFRLMMVKRIKLELYVSGGVKGASGNEEVFHVDNSRLFELAVLGVQLEEVSRPCSDKNGGCEQLCFPLHKGGNWTAICECADGFLMDGNTCKQDPLYKSPFVCAGNQFRCVRQPRCIDASYMCDGDSDCADGSDEQWSLCQYVPCSKSNGTLDVDGDLSEEMFRCEDDNRCMPKAWICDGEKDCKHGDDEKDCGWTKAGCPKTHFQCHSSARCIPLSFTCDLRYDCGPGDTSDEHLDTCRTAAQVWCDVGQFRCTSGQCIDERFVCDGQNDCRDGSDEKMCSQRCAEGLEFQCGREGPCLPSALRCDGILDCADGSDENADDCEYSPAHVCPHPNQFRCANSKECIRTWFLCDGQTDCLDGSDEGDSICKNNATGLAKCHGFKCEDGGSCVPLAWKCDGIRDCTDGSDEKECAVVSADPGRCVSPFWQCANMSTSCLAPEMLCNGDADCDDASDEGGLCEQKICDSITVASDGTEPKHGSARCDHTCHNTPDGFACSCHDGFKLQLDGRSCKKTSVCSEFGACSQRCTDFAHLNRHFCSCHSGFELGSDKFSCRSLDTSPAFLVYSMRYELRMTSLHGWGDTVALATKLSNSIALDWFYNVTDGSYLLFWTDIALDQIFRGVVRNSTLTHVQTIVSHGTITPEGLAVDWINHLLYWVDSSLDAIQLCTLDGKMRTTVLTGAVLLEVCRSIRRNTVVENVVYSGSMTNLRALVVDPLVGYMFWSDWDSEMPRIERATLGGNNRQIVVRVDTVNEGAWPNGIALDYQNEMLFWIDAKSDSIHAIDYEGVGPVRTIVKRSQMLAHPFAISLFENHVYWTDWKLNRIVKANKFNGSSISLVVSLPSQPFDLKVMHPSRQPNGTHNLKAALRNPCSENSRFQANGGCSHFCLVDGGGSSANRTCACPYLMKLTVTESLIYATSTAITSTHLTPTRPNSTQLHPSAPVLRHSGAAENASDLQICHRAKWLVWLGGSGSSSRGRRIYGSDLSGNGLKVLVDDDLANFGGIALDWQSQNLYYATWKAKRAFWSYGAAIFVMDLKGAHLATVVTDKEFKDLKMPSRITVDPDAGYLYYFDLGHTPLRLYRCPLDGSRDPENIQILDNGGESEKPKNQAKIGSPVSAQIDAVGRRLYWLDELGLVHGLDLDSLVAFDVSLKPLHPDNSFKNASTPAPSTTRYRLLSLSGPGMEGTETHGHLYLYDGAAIVRARLGHRSVLPPLEVVRNVTEVSGMAVMDQSAQVVHWKGKASEPLCTSVRGTDAYNHLCIQMGDTVVSKCAIGFTKSDTGRCVPARRMLLYSTADRIHAISNTEIDSWHDALAPIPNTARARSLDYRLRYGASGTVAGATVPTDGIGEIVWLDSEGSAQSVQRDLAERTVLLKGNDERILRVVTDWTSGNIYWSSTPLFRFRHGGSVPAVHGGSIKVADWRGKHRFVLCVTAEPVSLMAVDPLKGYLFYHEPRAGITRVAMNGSNPVKLFGTPPNVRWLALDRKLSRVCWLNNQTISCGDYGGGAVERMATRFSTNVSLVTHFEFDADFMYYYDRLMMNGSISAVNLTADGQITSTSVYQLKRHAINTDVISLAVADDDRRRPANGHPCHASSCAHLCTPVPTNGAHASATGAVMAHCLCSFGNLAPDGKSCVDEDVFAAFSVGDSIEFSRLDSEQGTGNPPLPPIKSNDFLRKAIGVAVDWRHRRLFYSDHELRSILAVRYDSSPHAEPYVLLEVGASVEGLAFDSYRTEIYYTQTGAEPSVRRLNVSSVRPADYGNGKKLSATVIARLKTGDRPRAVAVDECDMRVYWTDWSETNPRIERAYLSGYDRRVVVGTDIHTPNALALDTSLAKLYWADAHLDKLERCNLDGSRREVIASLVPISQHPFSMSLYGDHLYVTDWSAHALVRLDKHTGGDAVVLRGSLLRNPLGVAIVHNDGITVDGYGNGVKVCDEIRMNKCDDKCDGGQCVWDGTIGEFVCECRPPLILHADNKTCVQAPPDPEFEAVDCDPVTEFMCNNGQCISYEETCDGVSDCKPSGEDEHKILCADRHCRQNYFKCPSGQCINETKKCDGHNDCGDLSDELLCTCVAETEFPCANGRCVPKRKVCNHKNDCADGSDELVELCTESQLQNCSHGHNAIFGDTAKFINCARTTQCIMPVWLCDGNNDCWDNWDEENCDVVGGKSTDDWIGLKAIQCEPGEFRCQSETFDLGVSRACIPESWRCDGNRDCLGGSDEENCATCTNTSTHFNCGGNGTSGACVPVAWRCDGARDCANGADEEGCDWQQIVERVCDGKYRCDTDNPMKTKCIELQWLCDGARDCPKGDDEKDCENRTTSAQPECLPNEFECSNGVCVLGAFFCDGQDDCGDASDEPDSCMSGPCGADQFACTDGRLCVRHAAMCNGVDECHDGSDELESLCADITRCRPTEFRCANRVCVEEKLTCDGMNDCGDWSDENGCNVNECVTSQPCQHNCTDLRIGYKCACLDGFQLADDGHSCKHVDPCQTTMPCSQFCHARPGGKYECSCAHGYLLSPDAHTCKYVGSEPRKEVADMLLAVATKHSITLYDGKSVKRTVLKNLTNAVAIDYDYQDSTIYWTDVTRKKSTIGRASFDLSATVDNQFEQFTWLQTSYADGLAFDHAAGNLYWSDKGADAIYVVNKDGMFRKTVLKGKPLDEPRALAVDVEERLLFWSDWGRGAHIGRMALDGSGAQLVVSTTLRWPNALALDIVMKTVYWGDANLDYIGMCDYDGANRRQILPSTNHKPETDTDTVPAAPRHIFSLAVFDRWLYWTDWHQNSIWRADKFTGANVQLVVGALEDSPMGLKVMHASLQPPISPTSNACASNNGWCGNLCLAGGSTGGQVCRCPDGFKLFGATQCVNDCGEWQFVCERTYRCVDRWRVCDGVDDCGDGQDELYFKPDACAARRCDAAMWQCERKSGDETTKCIAATALCDGTSECPLGDDEGLASNHALGNKPLNCTSFVCAAGMHKCLGNEGVCLPMARVCDGKRDCPMGDDENQCPRRKCDGAQQSAPLRNLCPIVRSTIDCTPCPPQVPCVLGGVPSCLPRVFVCDGDADCDDGSDEPDDCAQRTCGFKEFHCTNGRCVPTSWTCDGQRDCPGGEDEQHCPEVGAPCNNATEFRCDDGRCIDLAWRCDGHADCTSGSDERQCATYRLPGGSASQTTSGANQCADASTQWPCADGTLCVHKAMRCDGSVDCADASDELHCVAGQPTVCKPGTWMCTSAAHCIPSHWVCDGHLDCADRSDEANCTKGGISRCAADQFACDRGATCVDQRFKCDGWNDCLDASDELPAMCRTRPCPPHMSKCGNGLCYPTFERCDGVKNCADGSDESDAVCGGVKCPADGTRARCPTGAHQCINTVQLCDGTTDCPDAWDEIDCDSFGNSGALCAERWSKCDQMCVHTANTTKCLCALGYELTATGQCRAADQWSYAVAVRAGYGVSVLERRHTTALVEDVPIHVAAQNKPYEMLLPFNDDFSHSEHASSDAIDFDFDTTGKWPSLIGIVPASGSTQTGLSMLRIDLPARRGARRKREAPAPTAAIPTSDKLVSITSLRVDHLQQLAFFLEHHTRPDNGFSYSSVRVAYYADKGNGEPVDFVADVLWTNTDGALEIALDPHRFRLFFSRSGARPAIESLLYSGDQRRPLVNTSIIYPTGLAYDRFGNRLYWADAKTNRIECVLADSGADRRVLSAFAFDQPRPYRIDFFEGAVYFSTISGGTVYSVSRYSDSDVANPVAVPHVRSNGTVLMAAAVRRSRNRSNLSVYSACSSSAGTELNCTKFGGVCVVAPNLTKSGEGAPVPVCLCPRVWHLVAAPDVWDTCHDSLSGLSAECDLHGVPDPTTGGCSCVPGRGGRFCERDVCHGRCLNAAQCIVMQHGGDVVCKCPVGYSGARCERYKCADACNAAGTLRCDPRHGSQPPVCQCDASHFGPRCERTRSSCNEICFNGGKCGAPGPGNHSGCLCLPGFDGARCEHCRLATKQLHLCHNGGHCVRAPDGGATCRCPPTFSGAHCESDGCQHLCLNGATCVRSDASAADTGLECICLAGYVGERCDKHLCEGYCDNGGRCEVNVTSGLPYCSCPPNFAGSKCERSRSCDEYCMNKGTCHHQQNGMYKCRCKPYWWGERCERPLFCKGYCHNGAECRVDVLTGFRTCMCPEGLGGFRCNMTVAKTCSELRCLNGATCTEARSSASSGAEASSPVCQCPSGWTGLVCALATCNDGYCLHGKCTLVDEQRICTCAQGYTGSRCERLDFDWTGPDAPPGRLRPHASPFAAGTIAALVMLLCVLLVAAVLAYRKREMLRRQFMHSRLASALSQEQLAAGESGPGAQQVHNPAFLAHDVDDEFDPVSSLQNRDVQPLVGAAAAAGSGAVVTNFSNPMYDSIYNDTVVQSSGGAQTSGGNEQHRALLNDKQVQLGPEHLDI